MRGTVLHLSEMICQVVFKLRARLCRVVPVGMTHGAVSGFVLLIVSAVGTWAVYGRLSSLHSPQPTVGRHTHKAVCRLKSSGQHCRNIAHAGLYGDCHILVRGASFSST